jgi:hypothetical protein
MKIQFTFLILVILLRCENNNTFKYEPIKTVVDTTVLSRKLDLIENVQIQESEGLILNTIWSVDINPHANKIILCDPDNRTCNLYNYQTGRIISFLKAGNDLSDSVAKSGKEFPIFRWTRNKSYKNIMIQDYPKYGLDYSHLKYLQNSFFVPYFRENKVYLLSLIYCQTISTQNPSDRLLSNRSAIVTCDSNLKIEKISVLDVNDSSYALPYSFFVNTDSTFFVSANDFASWRYYKKFASLPLITKYNYDGNILDIPFRLTDNYEIAKSGYNIPWFTTILGINGKIFFTTSCDLSVFSENNIKQFEFKNLPYSDDSCFIYYKKITDILDKNKITSEKLHKLFPIQIINGFTVKNNLVYQLVVYDKSYFNGYYFILQEYSTQGDLISQTNIYDEKDNKIKFISFDKVNNYLLLFKKSKAGWTMEKREWK